MALLKIIDGPKESLSITNIYCTFTMINDPHKPEFFTDFDLVERKVILTYERKEKDTQEKFLNWLKKIILNKLPVNCTEAEIGISGRNIIIEPTNQNLSDQEALLLFTKLTDRFITKKKNFIYEIKAFCLVNKSRGP